MTKFQSKFGNFSSIKLHIQKFCIFLSFLLFFVAHPLPVFSQAQILTKSSDGKVQTDFSFDSSSIFGQLRARVFCGSSFLFSGKTCLIQKVDPASIAKRAELIKNGIDVLNPNLNIDKFSTLLAALFMC